MGCCGASFAGLPALSWRRRAMATGLRWRTRIPPPRPPGHRPPRGQGARGLPGRGSALQRAWTFAQALRYPVPPPSPDSGCTAGGQIWGNRLAHVSALHPWLAETGSGGTSQQVRWRSRGNIKVIAGHCSELSRFVAPEQQQPACARDWLVCVWRWLCREHTAETSATAPFKLRPGSRHTLDSTWGLGLCVRLLWLPAGSVVFGSEPAQGSAGVASTKTRMLRRSCTLAAEVPAQPQRRETQAGGGQGGALVARITLSRMTQTRYPPSSAVHGLLQIQVVVPSFEDGIMHAPLSGWWTGIVCAHVATRAGVV